MEILFNQKAKKTILKAFNKEIDDDGYIVEKNNPEQKVLTQDEEEINIDEFCGIQRGSEIFIKSNISSLMQLADRLHSKD